MAHFGIFEKILLGIMIVMFLSLPFLLIRFNERERACEELGGVLVKTTEGYRCYRLERIAT